MVVKVAWSEITSGKLLPTGVNLHLITAVVISVEDIGVKACVLI